MIHHFLAAGVNTSGALASLKLFLTKLSQIGLPILWLVTVAIHFGLGTRKLGLKAVHWLIPMALGAIGVIVFLANNATLAQAPVKYHSQIDILLWIIAVGGTFLIIKDTRGGG